MERFKMLKAKRKRLREEQESRDRRVRVDVQLEDVNCSSQSPPRPTKRVCVDLAASSVRVLKEEDPAPVPVNACIGSTEVSKC